MRYPPTNKASSERIVRLSRKASVIVPASARRSSAPLSCQRPFEASRSFSAVSSRRFGNASPRETMISTRSTLFPRSSTFCAAGRSIKSSDSGGAGTPGSSGMIPLIFSEMTFSCKTSRNSSPAFKPRFSLTKRPSAAFTSPFRPAGASPRRFSKDTKSAPTSLHVGCRPISALFASVKGETVSSTTGSKCTGRPPSAARMSRSVFSSSGPVVPVSVQSLCRVMPVVNCSKPASAARFASRMARYTPDPSARMSMSINCCRHASRQ